MRQRKRRARAGFREAAFLHQRAAADLAERLEAIPRRFERVLALGGEGLGVGTDRSAAGAGGAHWAT